MDRGEHGEQRGRRPRLRRRAAALVVTVVALLAVPPAAGHAAGLPKLLAPTAGSHEFTVQAASMDVVDLAFVTTHTVTSGTATLTVLEFTASSAVLTGLVQTDPCVTNPAVTQSWAQVESTPASATTTLTGPLTLLASSLSYTPPGGPTVTFDSTALPPVGVLVASGTLPTVQITATSLLAASAQVHSLTVRVAPC